MSRDHDKRQISLFGLEFRTKTPFLSNPLLPEENENSTEMPPNPPSNPTPNDNHVPPLARRSQYSFPNIIQRKAHTFSPSYVNAPVSLEESRESIHPERSFLEEQKEIMRYMEDSRMEIAVILEGVDPLTSHTVQAFHSYTAEDIEWNHFFAPCTFLDYDGWTLVDFVKFHNLIPVPADADRVCSPSHC